MKNKEMNNSEDLVSDLLNKKVDLKEIGKAWPVSSKLKIKASKNENDFLNEPVKDSKNRFIGEIIYEEDEVKATSKDSTPMKKSGVSFYKSPELEK